MHFFLMQGPKEDPGASMPGDSVSSEKLSKGSLLKGSFVEKGKGSGLVRKVIWAELALITCFTINAH